MKKTTQQTAADMSHEIRNRLTYIMLSCDGLSHELQNVLAKEQLKEFSNIDVAATEIRTILDDLLRLLLAEIAEPRYKEEELNFLIGG
jgi:signal transduction histidine kinase